MQFFGTFASVLGIEAEVKEVDCPAENEIHPFDPIQN
jgi:hypothetical protein